MHIHHGFIEAVKAEHAWRTERVKPDMQRTFWSSRRRRVSARRRSRQLHLVQSPNVPTEITREQVLTDLGRAATKWLAS
jgi:hypothetical protein